MLNIFDRNDRFCRRSNSVLLSAKTNSIYCSELEYLYPISQQTLVKIFSKPEQENGCE